MEKFKKFYFEKYSFDEKNLKASFLFSFDKKEYFEEIIDFKNDLELNNNFDLNILDNFLFNLHIALWISYYKLFPTSELILESWFLKPDQITFWKKFYLNWLWEFLIKNDINPDDLFNFKNTKSNNFSININLNFELKSEKSLLMWWWWKDSIVSYSLIKDKEFDIFVVWKIDQIKENTIKITWKKPISVKRKLSDNLFKLNEEWYYNWHVPITWIIAFISLVFSYLYQYKNIILSNEKSASEENIVWKNLKINHQYSKSSEFEKDFWIYINKYLSQNIKYFSLLRWMYEYKIAEIFSKQEEFFKNFSSCNRNFKIEKNIELNWSWCWFCEKCCFVFLILSNFIEIDKLTKIFWKNLFDDPTLENIFIDLIWYWKNKPFECVWTYDESLLSFYNVLKNYNYKNYFCFKKIKKMIDNPRNNIDYKKLENKLLKIHDDDIIPIYFKKILENN